MANGMLQNPEWKQLGISSEAGMIAVKLLLCQLQTKAMTVERAAQSPTMDVQTLNMQADAEAKRKAEEWDNETTDESSDEEKKDLEELNKKEGDKSAKKNRVKRSTKKS